MSFKFIKINEKNSFKPFLYSHCITVLLIHTGEKPRILHFKDIPGMDIKEIASFLLQTCRIKFSLY